MVKRAFVTILCLTFLLPFGCFLLPDTSARSDAGNGAVIGGGGKQEIKTPVAANQGGVQYQKNYGDQDPWTLRLLGLGCIALGLVGAGGYGWHRHRVNKRSCGHRRRASDQGGIGG